MPRQTYALETGGPRRLEIRWWGFWRDLKITLDGEPVGALDDPQQLRSGREFILPDGSKLHVQLFQKSTLLELRVVHNGRLLSGVSPNRAVRIRVACIALYFIAGFNLLLGGLGAIGVETIRAAGIGWFNLAYGLVFLLLAFFTMRHSLLAIVLAVVIYALEGLATICLSAQGGNADITGILITGRLFLLMAIIPAIGALRSKEEQ